MKNEAPNEIKEFRYDASRDGAFVEKYTYDGFGNRCFKDGNT